MSRRADLGSAAHPVSEELRMRSDDPREGPGRELTVRTMAPPGASQDLFLRVLQSVFQERFRTQLVIDNAAGRDGIVAALRAKADPPDGRHLLVTSASTMSFYPAAGQVGFDETDFEPLLGVGRYNFVLITGGRQPWSDLHEVLDGVRAQGRALRYAGTGQPDLLLVSAMAKKAGVAVEFLPLNGPALLDAVLTGKADIGLGTGTHQPLLEDGRVQVVARLHSRAEPGDQAAPGPRDFGVGATLDNFILVSAPRGLEPSARDRLLDRLIEAVGTPEVTTLLTKRLLMAPGLTHGAELEAALKAQKQAFALLRAES
jgi:tripartite-type tricarboxylate transporter receptor subunit TctC